MKCAEQANLQTEGKWLPGREGAGRWGMTTKGDERVSFWDENVLKLTVGMVAQLCRYTVLYT